MSKPDLTDKTGTPVAVVQKPDRFLALVQGDPAAETLYIDRGRQRVYFHTETFEGFGGRGVARLLVSEALRRTIADGLRIVPVCSLVAGYLDKHPKLQPEVDEPTEEILDWLGAQLSD
jgi:hypothetical protein